MPSTFDRTFDRTFRGVSVAVPPASTPVSSPVSTCGITLMWLTPLGWAYWTFEAVRDSRTLSVPTGGYVRRGLLIDTGKQTTVSYVIRTGNLTRPESEHLASLLASVAVYWLREDLPGGYAPTPVRVETLETTVFTTGRNRTQQEFVLSLPSVYSLSR